MKKGKMFYLGLTVVFAVCLSAPLFILTSHGWMLWDKKYQQLPTNFTIF